MAYEQESREALKWDMEALATRLEKSVSAISRIETGKQNVSVGDIRAIAHALGVPQSALLGEKQAPSPATMRAIVKRTTSVSSATDMFFMSISWHSSFIPTFLPASSLPTFLHVFSQSVCIFQHFYMCAHSYTNVASHLLDASNVHKIICLTVPKCRRISLHIHFTIAATRRGPWRSQHART